MTGFNRCFKCEKEFYNGKREIFYVTATTKEKAYKKAVKENPNCYVRLICEVNN